MRVFICLSGAFPVRYHAAEAVIDCLPRTEALGQIAPRRARAEYSWDAIEHQAVALARPPLAARWELVLVKFPHYIFQYVTSNHAARPLEAEIVTDFSLAPCSFSDAA